jgi:WD repeat-containing protein 59
MELRFWIFRYLDYVKEKDVQMLAMLSMLVVQTQLGTRNISRVKNVTPIIAPLRMANMDYFSFTKSTVKLLSPTLPEWPHLPSSPVASSMAPSFSSSNSSRGSWSSLFNTGTMRQFMNGVQDSLKEGLSTPTEIIPPGISMIATRSTEKLGRTESDLPAGGVRKRRTRQESLLHTQAPTVNPKSWNESARQPLKPLSTSFSSAGNRQLRFTESSSFINESKVVIFEPDYHEDG